MVTHAASTYFLHVANGTATTRLFEPAGIPGRSSIWADPLYEGPVPGHLTDTELVEVRSRFLGGPLHADVDPVNDLRNWRAAIRQHESYEELVLWFEHDLFDQLNLIQLLTWIRDRLPNDKTVSLICIGSFPGRRRFKGLGELTADELASLFGGRKRVSEAQYSLAKRAWQAFREPTGGAAPGGYDAVAISCAGCDAISPGISFDHRWTVSKRASSPGTGRWRSCRSRIGIPAHARWRRRVLHH